jgi:predicted type IV restriction endonuclease
MRAVKYILIALSLFVGVSFIYAGMGINIPAVEYRNVTSYGVPVGMTFLLLAVMMARFWEDHASSDAQDR